VYAVAVLPDGRVVTGGWDGRVLVWDPAEPGAGPVELGRHDDAVYAVAVLPDGRVVTAGGDDRVWLRNVQDSSPGTLLACSAYALATSLSPSGARLFIGHAMGGIACWEVHPAAQNTPGARQRAGNAMHQRT
jgi:WD40 repeat protein